MKRIKYSAAVMLAILLIPMVALASDISGALFFGNIIISNNSTATGNISTNMTLNTDNLIADDFLNATANNTVIRNASGADVIFQPGWNGNDWALWVPQIGANAFLTNILYTANSTGGEIRYFPDSGGMTILDVAPMEPSDNFSFSINSWIDTDSSLSTVIIDKPGAFDTRVTEDGEITAGMYSLDVVNVSPTTFAAWADVDVSGYIASDATGVILSVDGAGLASGVRKNGSTDNRISIMEYNWIMIGVDTNGIFEAYLANANVVINLVGYTDSRWTFKTNADDVSLAGGAGVWTDVDVSAEAPDAVGVIIELESLSVGIANDGIRKNGSTDNRVDSLLALSHYFLVIGVDDAQIYEANLQALNQDMYLIGYVTSGSTFFTNGIDESLVGVGAWTDIDLSDNLTADADFAIFEVNSAVGGGHNYGFRKNGSTDATVQGLNFDKAWSVVPCDENQIVEGRIDHVDVDFFLIGFITSGGHLYYEEISESENQGRKVVAEGITEGDYDLSVSIKDDPGIASYDSSVNIGVSMGSGILPVRILEKQTLSAPAASVTFSGISGNVSLWDSLAGVTSRHLVVLVNAASPDAVAKRAVEIQFNGDSGANYNHQTLTGENAVDDADRQTGVNALFEYPGGTDYPFAIPGTTYANAFGGGTILIPHAFNTANQKSAIALGGAVEDYVSAVVGRWADTSAITSMVLVPDTGNFATGSTFILGVVDERYLVEEDLLVGDATIDFNNIPGDGHDLTVIGYLRGDFAATTCEVNHEINADAVAANYQYQRLRGDGAVTFAQSTVASFIAGRGSGDASGANEFSPFLITYSQYAEGANDSHSLSLSGYHSSVGPGSRVVVESIRWNDVSAITRLEYTANAGANFKAGSLFSLYRVPRFVIDRQELAAPAATITFANIPQGYEALQLNVYARSDLAAIDEDVEITINADAVAANYDFQELTGTGAVVAAARNAASQVIFVVPAANEGVNEFGAGVVTFNQYSTTVGHKHLSTLSGTQENQVILRSSRWEDTSAITRIDLDLAGANNFIAGSVFELVGVMPTKSFMIEIDGEVEAIEAASDASVIDNASDWIIGSDATPYIEQYRHFVGGNLLSDISWEYAATFTDASGNGNDATPTFRTASMDADVVATLTTFQPVEEAKAPPFALADPIPFIEGTGNMTGNFTTGPTIPGTGFPLAGVVAAVAGATTPPQLPLMMIAVFVILAFSLGYSSITRRFGSGSIVGKAFVILALMGIFIALKNFGFDWWMVITTAILLTAISMGSRQQSWQ